MAYGGLRYGGGFDFGRDVCIGAGHGADVADDLPAGVLRFRRGLRGGGVRAVAALLQAEPDEYLHLLGTAVGEAVVLVGGMVLPVVEDDGSGGEVLRGVHHLAAICVRCRRRTLLGKRSRTGAAHLALYPSWWHQDASGYRHVADALSADGAFPYYI